MKYSSKLLLGVSIAIALSAAFIFRGSSAQQSTAPDGEKLYQQKCAMCHDNPTDRIPAKAVLAQRTADSVIAAMTTGSMKPQAAGLKPEEIRAIAVYVTGKQPSAQQTGKPEVNACKAPAGPLNLKAPQWNGWGVDHDNSHFQPKPGLKPEDVPKLKVKWAFAHPGGTAYGQPTVIGERLYVTGDRGQIFSLNAQTGCTYWTINVGSGVRSSISVGPLPSGSPAKFAAYFGDEKSIAHAVDAETGKPLWETKIEEHPSSRITGSPVLNGDRLYVPVSSIEEVTGRNDKYECCKFRGSIVALEAYTGKVIWKSYSIPEEPKPFKKNSAGTQMYGPAGAAIWGAPTLDLKRKVIYGGTGNSYTDAPNGNSDSIIAFDLATGKIKWVNQATPNDNFLVSCRQAGVGNCPADAGPDVDFGSSVIVRKLAGGKQVLLAGQKSGMLYALDPDNNGKKLWEAKIGFGSALGGIEWGFAADAEQVYVPIADPIGPEDKRKPGLTALKIATGEKVWHVPAPAPQCSWGKSRCLNAQSAAIAVIPGIVFSGSMDGHMRAYATKDGSVVWDFDTAAAPYSAVNGRQAKGGSIDSGGPVVVNGVLYVNSGYGRIVGQPGNALLAFTVDGR